MNFLSTGIALTAIIDTPSRSGLPLLVSVALARAFCKREDSNFLGGQSFSIAASL